MTMVEELAVSPEQKLRKSGSAFPSIEVADDNAEISLPEADLSEEREEHHLEERERARNRANQGAESDRVIQLQSELNRIFAQPIPSASVRNSLAQDVPLSNIAQTFPIVSSGESEVVLRNDKAAIIVIPSKISFVAVAGENGSADVKNAFTAESAYAMAVIASKNKLMLEKGIRLTGNKEQQALLRQAVERVNADLPADQQLRIRDDKEPAPKPAPVSPTVAFKVRAASPAAAAEPQASTPKPAISQPVDRSRRGFLTLSGGKNVKPAEAAPSAMENATGAAKTEGPRAASSLSRRNLLIGGAVTAAAAAVPHDAHAGEAGRPRNFFDFLFGRRDEPEAVREVSAPVPTKKPRRSGKKQKGQGRRKKTAKHRHSEDRHEQQARHDRHDAQKPKRHKDRSYAEQPDKRLSRRYQEAAEDQQAETMRGARSGGVSLYNTHTGKRLFLDFNSCGSRSCSNEFNRFALDHYSGAVANMDPNLHYHLRDIVTNLRDRGHRVDEVHVISGYRTVHTNTKILHNPSGSASQHCEAKALDIAVPGVRATELHQASCEVIRNSGGVGKYRSFVHIDTRGYGARW